MASNLFAALEVYVDSNASGAFEPGVDAFVTALYSPDLETNGGVSFDLTASEPDDVQVANGSSRNYFVVAQMNSDASTASPNAFRMTHVGIGLGASSAVETANGNVVTLSAGANITSKVITASANQGPTTTGIADVVAFDNAAQGIVALYPAFHDAEDGSNLLSYELTGNTNAGLFSFVGIEATTGRLLMTYLPGVTGSSQLTVKASDTLGKSVTASFQVKVIPFVTYSDFQTVHPGAGGPLESSLGNGVSNLLSYAFFLNQGANGGTLGLPRMQGVGNAKIFSHLRPKQASDVFYSYQVSQNMQTWVPAVKNVDYYENAKDLGDGSVRVELLLLNGWQKAFMRVQTQLIGAPAPPLPSAPPAPPDESQPAAPLPPPPPPPLSTGIPIASSVSFPVENVLGTNHDYASGMIVKDLNGDGKKDILVASVFDDKVAWYPSNGDGTFGAQQVITTSADGATCVAAGDLNGDGRIDVVSGSINDNKIAWYSRNANGSYTTQPAITNSANYPTSVEIADLNGDGLQDIIFVSHYGKAIYWARNNGGGSFQAPAVLIGDLNYPWPAVVADLDGDGKMDIATATINSRSVEWYKGNGNGTFGPKILLTPLNQDELGGTLSMCSGDIDGDGYVDLITGHTFGRKIFWFKNNQNLGFGPRQSLTNQVRDPYAVTVGDLDNDGKLDVIAAIASDNKVSWYRNLGGGNFGDPDSNQVTISDNVSFAYSVGVGDFDQDGLMDVASTSQNDSKASVYLNRGGQTGLSTTDIAPAVILDGQSRAVLRIEVANRGIAGNNNARLDTVSLLLESTAGAPLSTAEANALIENLRIFADSNDSGAFEPGVDQSVAIVPYLSLNSGKITVAVRGNALAVQVAPGTSRSFFVVPQLTANAASQSPNTFRMTHFTQGTGRSTTRDAYSSVALTVEASPVSSVVSSVSAAQTNSAPTTTGLPSITVFDTVAPSSILVRNYFADLEDGAAGLRYEITGNTNPGLLSFLGIDSAGKLVIRYRPGIAGSTSVTVKATDSLGKSVSSSFAISVSLANTFSNWSGGGGAAGQSGLLRYAFGLTPQGGDVAGLPKLKIQGNAKVITHQKPAWATDLNYQYEISQDMQTWIPAVAGVHFHEFTKDVPNALIQSDCVLLVNWPKAYMRIRAALNN